MRWHKEKCENDGVLRHPADAGEWKEFDKTHESFAQDPRNVRLGLATDGFNPFSNMSLSHSTWPVILLPYNLPPWKCLKAPFFILSMLIPGPTSPGNDIDVFLEPLIDELKDLWDHGVETYDASTGTNFNLCAAILWTIHDFPGYGIISGWSTKGYLYKLKQYVGNKAFPEGSMAEGYIAEECLTFCSMYLNDIETQFSKAERNYERRKDRSQQNLSVFCENSRLVGKGIYAYLDEKSCKQVHAYVLKNCDEVLTFISEHKEELKQKDGANVEKRHEESFSKWFEERVVLGTCEKSHAVNEDLVHLAYGPDKRATHYEACIVNGIRFHTKRREMNKKTQNSGVVVKVEEESGFRDYYGVLTDIIQLDYLGNHHVVLFKCDWYEGRSVQKDKYGCTSINTTKPWKTNEPYVLASQAQQVFYVNDIKLGSDWKVVIEAQGRSSWSILENKEYECVTIEESCQHNQPGAHLQSRFHTSSRFPCNIGNIKLNNLLNSSFLLLSMATRSRTMNSSGLDMATRSQGRREQTQVELDSQEPPSESIVAQQIDNNTEVEKKRGKAEKLEVTIHLQRKRIVGKNAKDFKTEVCVVIKQHAPLQYARWKDIPTDIIKKMWLAMKQKFNLQENFQVKKIVIDQLNRQYRSRRHKLHAYYLKRKDDKDILHKPPNGVLQNDWEQFINYVESDEFKRLSDRNKENRKKLTMSHACGTKSIAQYCFEERDPETEQEPTRTDAWRITRHSNKKNGWVDQASGVAFRINTELEKENEELRKKAEEDSKALETLKEKNKEMALRLESLESQVNNQEAQVQSQVQDFLKSQLPAIIQNLGISGHPLANV
ncbi:hypothetical protein BUALT_Bualt12G0110700 [Buddleja alternifolia]|uniref:DUF4216 domain-containing protein n=1 Tax=Buddleja alternifolia TaxID=168488 RepID=A0AAV6WRN0_9LAMI|nr:hypothetical protein BUALT_Bualt12G0110700 [Buddleja alternifolia]